MAKSPKKPTKKANTPPFAGKPFMKGKKGKGGKGC